MLFLFVQWHLVGPLGAQKRVDLKLLSGLVGWGVLSSPVRWGPRGFWLPTAGASGLELDAYMNTQLSSTAQV